MKFFFFLFLIVFYSLPGLGQEEDNFVDEVQKDREEVETKAKLNHFKESKKEEKTPNLFDEKVVRELQALLKKNPLSKTSPEEVKNLILESASNRPAIHRYLLKSPRIVNCLVELVRDKEALPGALNVFLKRSQLKLYGVIWLVLFLFQWMLKKIFFKKAWGVLTRFTLNVFVGLIFTGVSLGVFYNLFKKDLSPAVEIISKHWQSSRRA